MNKPIDGRSMATRLQASGGDIEADLEMVRRKMPITPEARVNGNFEIEAGRRHAPKSLLPGKYCFLGELEENEWSNSRKFWRCATLGVFQDNENVIIDYEMLNISTLLAYESKEIVNGYEMLIGYIPDTEKYDKLLNIKKYFIEVTELLQNSKYKDYWNVKWKSINKSEFIINSKRIFKTSTVKKLEELENIDVVKIFTK